MRYVDPPETRARESEQSIRAFFMLGRAQSLAEKLNIRAAHL